MAKIAVESEYETVGDDGVRHIPSDIKVRIVSQNVRGDWNFEKWAGRPNHSYDERQVVQLGQEILVKRKKKIPA